jgi:hypothetical protein
VAPPETPHEVLEETLEEVLETPEDGEFIE